MRTALVLGALGALLFASMLGAILVGAVAIAPADVWAALWGGADQTTGTIVRDLRLTRVFAAALVGGSLAVAGALLQGLLRNPLADPYVTGTSAGASLSAVAAIALGAAAVPAILPLAAFVGALAAAAVVWRLASLGGRTTVLTVLLAGIVLSLLVASDRIALRLRAVLGWLLGGVSVTDRSELAMATAIIVVAGLAAFALARRLDAFALGDETAATLGVDVDRATTTVLAVAALLTGAAVALGGVIGFVGLIVPHALRPLLGAPHARLVPACFLLGATTLVVADAAARVVLSPAELPVGVITGLVGGPFFLALLLRGRRPVVV